MTNKTYGVYVHIPFCVRKCNYCDFCSFSGKTEVERDAYVKKLCTEIRTVTNGIKPNADSVFFGGGTPSLLSPAQFTEIADTLRECFTLADDTEFSVEMNPGTVTDEILDACVLAGVNRVSLGLQSIRENEQKLLGRIHNADDFYRAVNMIKSHGITNFNVDVMYGIPDQTAESFRETLDAVLSVAPTHVSAYSLILEEETPLYRNRHAYAFPTEDEELSMVQALHEKLSAAGFSHYEISNYAKAGYRCRHNLKYWQCLPYLGFGVAAASYDGAKRYLNTESFDKYLSADFADVTSAQALTDFDKRYEYAMLALRTSDGFSLDEYRARFGVPFAEGKDGLLAQMQAQGLLILDGGRIALTEAGFYVSNEILVELL